MSIIQNYKKFIKLLLFFFALGTFTAGIIIGYFYWESYRMFPNLQEKIPIFAKNFSVNILDINGKNIAYSHQMKSIIVNQDQVPKKLKKTLVAVEDKDFFHHKGVSLISTFRSIILLPIFLILRVRPWGASTITQQLIRNIFLNKKYSFLRKSREIILAFRIEKQLTKEEILNLYLNVIYFGKGIYGIGTAAKAFFNKSLNELNAKEIAFLVGVIKNPSWTLENNHEGGLIRRNFVLSVMLQNQLIDKNYYEEAINDPIKYYNGGGNPRVLLGRNFIDEVLAMKKKILKMYDVNNKNISIYTTMDLRIQQIIEPILKQHIERINENTHQWYGTLHMISRDKLATMDRQDQVNLIKKYNHHNHGSNIFSGMMVDKNKVLLSNNTVVSLENYKVHQNHWDLGHIFLVKQIHDKFYAHQSSLLQGSVIVTNGQGQILAMTGTYDYDLSQYNRTKTPMQINSVMKILIYGFLLENSIAGDAMVADEPVTVNYCNQSWSPKNWDDKFMGYMTVKQAFLLSRNCATINAVLLVPQWEKKLRVYTAKFGIYNFQPSYILGANEMTLQQAASIMAILVNGGKAVGSPHLIHYLTMENETIYQNPVAPDYRILSEEICQELYEVFKDNNIEGLTKSLNFPRDIATKSGTSNENKRLNFVGFKYKSLSVFVTIAKDTNEKINALSSQAGIIARDIWKALKEGELD